MLTTILLVAAFVLFVIATFWWPGQPTPPWGKPNLIAAGLACWVLSILLGGVHV